MTHNDDHDDGIKMYGKRDQFPTGLLRNTSSISRFITPSRGQRFLYFFFLCFFSTCTPFVLTHGTGDTMRMTTGPIDNVNNNIIVVIDNNRLLNGNAFRTIVTEARHRARHTTDPVVPRTNQNGAATITGKTVVIRSFRGSFPFQRFSDLLRNVFNWNRSCLAAAVSKSKMFKKKNIHFDCFNTFNYISSKFL